MKRSAAFNDNDSDDDEIFQYSNKLKLTFSKSAFTDINNKVFQYSSSSDSESSDDDLSLLGNGVKRGAEINNAKKCQLPKQLSKVSDILKSPSPPPPCVLQPPKERPLRKADRAQLETISLLRQKLTNSPTSLHGDVICLAEDNPMMKLKIRLHGTVEKYELRKAEPLFKLICDIAKKENVQPGFIALNWGNTSINPKQSIDELGLTIADIIECVIHAEDIDEERICVRIQSASSSSVYKISLNEPVERIVKDFCNKYKACINKSKFRFDGESIKNYKCTFSELDIIEGDVIDADLKFS